MPLRLPLYLAAACRYGAECGGAGCTPEGGDAGSGTWGTPGVPSWPTSQGSAAANARAANGQSCLPGCITTAHLIPWALPIAHSELAAAVWSLAFAAAFTTTVLGGGVVPLMSNQPETPVYGPWRVMTVIGSKAA